MQKFKQVQNDQNFKKGFGLGKIKKLIEFGQNFGPNLIHISVSKHKSVQFPNIYFREKKSFFLNSLEK